MCVPRPPYAAGDYFLTGASTGALAWSPGPFPEKPTTGKYVLGLIDGTLTWIATQEC
jgi:hypothetical protein